VSRRAWACLVPFVSESEIECTGGAMSSAASSLLADAAPHAMHNAQIDSSQDGGWR
jgi:hypothetical protein